MRQEKPIKYQIYDYMNQHPNVGLSRLKREFKDVEKAQIYVYRNEYEREIKDLRWLYEFMVNKWIPVRKFTQANRIRLKKIEERIGME